MKHIETAAAPAPGGMYSQAVVHDGIVYVAGQLGLDPQTGKTVSEEFEGQLRQALKNVQAILEASGSDLSRVMRFNVYLSDERQFPVMNRVFGEMIPKPYPARTARIVAMGNNFLVEVDATAATDLK